MRISVFITSYNQRQFLIEAIDSVLNQTMRPCQIIVVDDCSTDGSPELIAGYAARYPDLITPIYHTQNQGVTRARIDALQAVTGEYVTYVDGDDRFLPAKLEKEARVLQEHPNVQIAFSNNRYVSTDGTLLWVWADAEKPPEGNVFRQTFARDFPRRNLFRMELVNYRAWRHVGFHDPWLELYEDFDMRIRLTHQYRVAYHDEPLTEVRVHATGLSSSKATRHLAALEYIYAKNKPLLNGLTIKERCEVRRQLGEWIANIARQASEEALWDRYQPQGGKLHALEYYLKSLSYEPRSFRFKLFLKIILADKAYQRLKAT